MIEPKTSVVFVTTFVGALALYISLRDSIGSAFFPWQENIANTHVIARMIAIIFFIFIIMPFLKIQLSNCACPDYSAADTVLYVYDVSIMTEAVAVVYETDTVLR